MSLTPHILTIESTCDETAAAVITLRPELKNSEVESLDPMDRVEVLGSVVASQEELHQRFGGVVPEIASRAHLERILPVIDETLNKSGIELKDLNAIAVANRPGLAGSILVGLVAAKTLCVATGLPLIATNHLQAHIYACRIAAKKNVFPCIGMIVSGGHTSLYRCSGPLDFELLGGTIDDAAGEAFDKVAAMLGLPYPGGPSIQKAAVDGDPKAYDFPRALLKDKNRLEFSFSGLKTAVRYKLVGYGKTDFADLDLSPQQVADLAASFQEATVDCLVGKASQALKTTGMKTLCVGGGVAANSRFRERLEEEAARRDFELHIAPLSLCTDNAVMGAIALERFLDGAFESLDLDAYPGLLRSPQ
jgi:N6-L-threonylcarbamoyladenine synthase